jgi:Kef-type K+ transport system membrane component KefB/CBS domain-containing protein
MQNQPSFVFLGLAVIFLVALFVSRFLARFRIPRVTGYLLTGLLTGPSLAKIVDIPTLLTEQTLERMQSLANLALVLILISIGMRFRGENLQRWRSRILIFSFGEILVTFLIVAALAGITNFFLVHKMIDGFGSLAISSIYICLFLGVLAMETAPAATLLVIREYESEGPLTDVVTMLLGLNGLIVIIAFNTLVHFTLTPDAGVGNLILRILIPIGIGSAFGILMSSWAQRLDSVTEFQLLILGGSLGILATCKIFGFDFLLACLIAGIVLVNSSPKADDLLQALKKFDYALYVVFFVLAGASLHLDALGQIGIVGLVYIVGRISGKLIGNFLGAKFGQFNKVEQKCTGFTMLAHAGVAIGLSQTLLALDAPGARYLSTIVFGSIVVFELLGPIFVRQALVWAGEVPLLTLLTKKAPSGAFEGLHQVVNHFRSAIGLPPGHKVESAQDVLVKHIMRTNVDTIRDNLPFNELLHQIAHSRYDRFPVVSASSVFVGVIDYEDIRDVLFDAALSPLVVAMDLVKKVALVTYPDSTLRDILAFFKQHKNISYLPVVETLNPTQLVGMISQNDVLATFRKIKKK